MEKLLLEIKNLQKRYPLYGALGKMFPPKNHVKAVADVSLQIYEGETYGLVGESGCGKTTTGRSVLGLVKPDGGEILYDGKDLTKLKDKEYLPFRKDIQMVFQNTLASMNPRTRIGEQMEEPMIIQKMGDPKTRREKVLEMLKMVGLSEEHYFRYPHELSGGQVQRLGIARALIIEPKLIICDEPVSALDVSIQAQILNMMTELQKKMNLSIFFISHDISVVRYISNRIGVMYLGTLVEEAETEELFAHTMHPYTLALFESVPDIKKEKTKMTIKGELPVYTDDFKGCVFHTRCPKACDKCRECAPQLREVRLGHKVACHFCEE